MKYKYIAYFLQCSDCNHYVTASTANT